MHSISSTSQYLYLNIIVKGTSRYGALKNIYVLIGMVTYLVFGRELDNPILLYSTLKKYVCLVIQWFIQYMLSSKWSWKKIAIYLLNKLCIKIKRFKINWHGKVLIFIMHKMSCHGYVFNIDIRNDKNAFQLWLLSPCFPCSLCSLVNVLYNRY